MPHRSNDPNLTYSPTTLEQAAMKTVDSAYQRNKNGWKDTHERQHRLFRFVMGGTDPDKVEIAGRSHIKTGIPFMIYQIILAIMKNSLISVPKNIKLEPTKLRQVIFGQEEMEEYLDFLMTDDMGYVKKPIEHGLSDLISHGTTCQRPYFENDVRKVWDGETEFEQLVYSGPAFVNNASWDTYPTAGATCPDELHEVIFLESYYPHELREWERKGWIENVDYMLRNHVPPTSEVEGDEDSHKDPRIAKEDELETDEDGKIKVLIYWGLFPLYRDDEYLGDDGSDRSAEEVECLIIKPVNQNVILRKERNQYYHQMKEVIFGKYFDIPGELWGESIFGMIERLLVHQEDWVNIIQDSANDLVYQDEVIPDNIDEAEENQPGPGRKYHVTAEELADGKVPTVIEKGKGILPEAYEQRDYTDRVVQEVSGILDFLKGAEGDVQKTATEINKLTQSLNVRFEQAALSIQGSYMVPVASWMMSMLSQFSVDDYIMAYTGLEMNAFKQFDPMIPNTGFRISLEGSKKAIMNQALQGELVRLMEIGRELGPMPDSEGNLVVPNITEMFFDLVSMSNLPDPDQYKLIVPEPPGGLAPEDDQVIQEPQIA